MGQRHQIYIRLPQVVSKYSGEVERKELTIGFHHQWLYGATAIQVLDNFLTFYSKAKKDKYSPFVSVCGEDVIEVCKTVLSYLPRTGKIENLHSLNDPKGWGYDCTDNPKNGDNNDGITIIDLTGPKPRYSFASIWSTEGKVSLREGLYSAAEYIASYYPELNGDYSEVGGRDSRVGAKKSEINVRLKRLAKVEQLDATRVMEIFPAWRLVDNSRKVYA